MINIEWSDFIFKVEGSAAILIAAAPAILFMQLPPVIRGITKLVRYTARMVGRARQQNLSLAARVMAEEVASCPKGSDDKK